jgi:hypothetical protein
MKVTVNLPKELIEEAKNISGKEDLNDLINESLNEQIDSIKKKELLNLKGEIDFKIFLDDLRKRKR